MTERFPALSEAGSVATDRRELDFHTTVNGIALGPRGALLFRLPFVIACAGSAFALAGLWVCRAGAMGLWRSRRRAIGNSSCVVARAAPT